MERERYRGCILGLAIGDALGMPTEFLSLAEIRARWGPEGVTDLEAGSWPAGSLAQTPPSPSTRKRSEKWQYNA